MHLIKESTLVCSTCICVVHAHTTASATEAFLLPALGCGMLCHHIYGGTWTTDISSMHWKDICLGYSRPRHIVINLFSCALEAYLLTYLHEGNQTDSGNREQLVSSGTGVLSLWSFYCSCWHQLK